ncbi:MAG TPA: hypothetical protein VKA64_09815, partial [Gammaproteobacteria bacterium]|nr:hypothetical protein [Gammaproteobacteria bacterium]
VRSYLIGLNISTPRRQDAEGRKGFLEIFFRFAAFATWRLGVEVSVLIDGYDAASSCCSSAGSA